MKAVGRALDQMEPATDSARGLTTAKPVLSPPTPQETEANSSMKCPNCKLLNPPGAMRCDCGYDFATGEIQPVSGTSRPRSSAKTLKHSFKVLPPAVAELCHVRSISDPIKCPNCKLLNPPGTMWCECGYDFATGRLWLGGRKPLSAIAKVFISLSGILATAFGLALGRMYGLIGLVLLVLLLVPIILLIPKKKDLTRR